MERLSALGNDVAAVFRNRLQVDRLRSNLARPATRINNIFAVCTARSLSTGVLALLSAPRLNPLYSFSVGRLAAAAPKMAERVKKVAAEEAEKIKTLTAQAVQSRAYLYPIKGIFYFVSHRSLWQPLLSKLTPTITLGVGVTVALFAFLYVPQMAVMAFTSGPVAAVTAALLTLSESSTLTNILARAFLIEDALIDTFDGTLVSRDCTALVSDGREIKPGRDPIARLGKLIKKPFARFSPAAIIRYLLYLPLNFIPVVGTVMFVVLQGKQNGPNAHARYFQLKGWSGSQKEAWIEQNRAAYTAFGVAASLLEMVPVATFILSFTSTVGAALWAADMEAEASSTAPYLRETAKKAE